MSLEELKLEVLQLQLASSLISCVCCSVLWADFRRRRILWKHDIKPRRRGFIAGEGQDSFYVIVFLKLRVSFSHTGQRHLASRSFSIPPPTGTNQVHVNVNEGTDEM